MTLRNTRLLAALGFLAALAAAPAVAQESGTAPATPGATDMGEELDSGVGETDTGAWIGRPVVTVDGETVGELARVDAASDNTDGGTLVIAREGGEEVKAPLQGASFDGTSVTVPVPLETIENPPAASVN